MATVYTHAHFCLSIYLSISAHTAPPARGPSAPPVSTVTFAPSSPSPSSLRPRLLRCFSLSLSFFSYLSLPFFCPLLSTFPLLRIYLFHGSPILLLIPFSFFSFLFLPIPSIPHLSSLSLLYPPFSVCSSPISLPLPLFLISPCPSPSPRPAAAAWQAARDEQDGAVLGQNQRGLWVKMASSWCFTLAGAKPTRRTCGKL